MQPADRCTGGEPRLGLRDDRGELGGARLCERRDRSRRLAERAIAIEIADLGRLAVDGDRALRRLPLFAREDEVRDDAAGDYCGPRQKISVMMTTPAPPAPPAFEPLLE
jgi:hypothetical protein